MLNLWSLAERTRPIRANPARAYLLALLLVLLAVVARLISGPALSSFPFLVFYPPVLVAAFLCGPGPAVMTVLLGLVLSLYFMFDIGSTLRFEGGGLYVAIGFYTVTNALFIALTDGMLTAMEGQRAAARRLELAMDAGGLAVFELDLADEHLVATPELNTLLGFAPAAVLDLDRVKALLAPYEWERLRDAARHGIQANERYFELEFQARRPDEALHWYALNAEILRGKKQSSSRILGVLSDITGRKEIEQGLEDAVAELKVRQQELNAVLDASGIAPFDFDLASRTFRPSPRLNALYGFSPDHNLTYEEVAGFYHPPEGVDYHTEGTQRSTDPNRRGYEIDMRLRLPGNKIKWITARGEYIRDASGRALRSRGLAMDVTARKELEETRELLLKELEHRIKNTLATVSAITAQTLKGDIKPEEARAVLDGRFAALAGAHSLLTRQQWHGARLQEVVATALRPHMGSGQIVIAGPDCEVTPKQSLALTLGLHELATNAIKYGALSSAEGRVSVDWQLMAENGMKLYFHWRETGGPQVAPPTRKGFGTRIIQRVLPADFGGEVTLEFRPEGLVCSLMAPLPEIS